MCNIKAGLLIVVLLFGSFTLVVKSQNRDAVEIVFRPRTNIIYPLYANNNNELAALCHIIAQYEDVILTGNGHVRLVANVSPSNKDNLSAINLGAMRSASISSYLRQKFRYLTRWNFSFLVDTTSNSSDIITVSYIPYALPIDAPKDIYYTQESENRTLIKREISKYGAALYLNNAKRSEQGDVLPNDIAQKATAAVVPISPDANASKMLIAIYYRWDKSTIDSMYLSNAQHLSILDSILKSKNAPHIDTLTIVAFASPEGNANYNKRLSQQRANTIRDYIVHKYPNIAPGRIVTIAKGENWQGVHNFAATDKNLPLRSKVLEILSAPMSHDAREKALRALAGGTIYYRYMLPNYYRYLRNGASILVTYNPQVKIEQDSVLKDKKVDEITQADSIEKSVEIKQQEAEFYIKKYHIALRTNLLYDAIGAFNLGVEIPIYDKWSVLADCAYAYWRSPLNMYALQTLEYGVEGRYWFGESAKKRETNPNWAKPLKGLNVGIYGRYWMRYDMQWVDGIQGDDAWSGGLTIGYVFPIGKQLSLETGIGAGWIYTSQYRHYHQPEYNKHGKYHLMWQETGTWSGLSITKVRLSVLWLITYTQKGGHK